ncbi:hypothetical protein EDD16DRAFT_1726583 [Pisolithus croceorrhizus]|nr:hypothetical protein EDD16DRAFT_1726583 [Pisolithus croceorrhizus]KAI6160607.1 hypothetical protein EDD17DRAFT_1897987 [Pisolithus thermaeus]
MTRFGAMYQRTKDDTFPCFCTVGGTGPLRGDQVGEKSVTADGMMNISRKIAMGFTQSKPNGTIRVTVHTSRKEAKRPLDEPGRTEGSGIKTPARRKSVLPERCPKYPVPQQTKTTRDAWQLVGNADTIMYLERISRQSEGDWAYKTVGGQMTETHTSSLSVLCDWPYRASDVLRPSYIDVLTSLYFRLAGAVEGGSVRAGHQPWPASESAKYSNLRVSLLDMSITPSIESVVLVWHCQFYGATLQPGAGLPSLAVQVDDSLCLRTCPKKHISTLTSVNTITPFPLPLTPPGSPNLAFQMLYSGGGTVPTPAPRKWTSSNNHPLNAELLLPAAAAPLAHSSPLSKSPSPKHILMTHIRNELLIYRRPSLALIPPEVEEAPAPENLVG